MWELDASVSPFENFRKTLLWILWSPEEDLGPIIWLGTFALSCAPILVASSYHVFSPVSPSVSHRSCQKNCHTKILSCPGPLKMLSQKVSQGSLS